MSDLPAWMIFAGILLAALVIYAVAWRIVQGTHVVVRAATRIILGALIVVPLILFVLYGQQGMMRQEATVESAQPPSYQESLPASPPPATITDAAPREGAASAEKAAEAPTSSKDQRARLERAEKAKAEREALETKARRRMAAEDGAKRMAEEEALAPAAESDKTATSVTEAPTVPAERSAEVTARPASPPEPADVAAMEEAASAPMAEEQPTAAAAPEAGAGSPREAAEMESSSEDVAAMEAPAESAEPPPYLESLPASPPPAAANGGHAPEPASPPPAPDVSAPPAAPGSSANLESISPAAGGAPEEEHEDWSVVPVFYGTDRKRADKPDRIAYDWQRGRRLELGLAYVTVPKQHEVPMVERPWALKIPYVDIVIYEAEEDPKKHFTLKELRALTKQEFLTLVRERLAKSARFKDHALVFIHGYKNKFDNAVFRTAQIAYDLKFDGASFLYSWPSGGTLQGYTYDRESASGAEPHLKEFLKIVRDETGAKKLSVIAHSMGNQLLLRVLQDLKRSTPEGVLISQLILAAPDVDRDSFEYIVKSIEGIADGITLYAAANDAALMFSRQVNGGEPRAGDVPDGGPIVVEGVDTIDATATSMDSVGINHSGYAENNALLEDIGRLIGEGIRPPGVRLPKLQRVETDKGAYWRYPPPQ